MRSLGSVGLGVACWFLTACGGDFGAETADEPALGEEVAAIGPFCGSSTQTACWDLWGNFGPFDITAGLECGVVPNPKPGGVGGYDWHLVDCFVARGTSVDTTRKRVNHDVKDDIVPGGDIKSLAVATAYLRDGTVFMLGSDNKVRASVGRIDGDFYAGFKNTIEHMQPVDTKGNSVCLKQIVWVTLPSAFAPSGTLLGLTCAGTVYARTSHNGAWKWTPAASAGLPWNRLPAGTWLEISKGTRGAYLLSSTRAVLKLGDGVADSQGNIVWDNARWLPLHTVPAGWKVQHVGGQFILVGPDNERCPASNSCPWDPIRVMKFTGQSYVTAQGTSSAPNDGVMPWDGIVDAANFNGRPGGYGLHHSFQRVYSYRP